MSRGIAIYPTEILEGGPQARVLDAPVARQAEYQKALVDELTARYTLEVTVRYVPPATGTPPMIEFPASTTTREALVAEVRQIAVEVFDRFPPDYWRTQP